MSRVLVVARGKLAGSYCITDEQEEAVAWITRTHSAAFTATGHDGVELCRGSRLRKLPGRWEVVDPAGVPLVQLRLRGPLAAHVDLARHGSWRIVDSNTPAYWELRKQNHRVVMTVGSDHTGSLRHSTDVVTCENEELSLAEIVGVVEAYRRTASQHRWARRLGRVPDIVGTLWPF